MFVIPYLGNAIQMLQAIGDIVKFLENTPETPAMTFSFELQFKRLNADCTRVGRLFFSSI
jgi:hypothetical protein